MKNLKRNFFVFVALTLLIKQPVFVFASVEEQTEGFLTLPIDITSVNSHFDLDEEYGNVEDVTGYTCEGGCKSTPGNHAYDGHKGIDFRAITGANVVAAIDGMVTEVVDTKEDNWHPQEGKQSFGNYIKIETVDENILIVYAHLQGANNILVKTGDTIRRGQTIATSDNTGSSYGAHLHFEVRKDGESVDPFEENMWITEETTKDITDTDYILTAADYEEFQKNQEPPGFWKRIWIDIQALFVEEGEGGGEEDNDLERKTWTNEEALAYVRQANGAYSEVFLDWVGWRALEDIGNSYRGYSALIEINTKVFAEITGIYKSLEEQIYPDAPNNLVQSNLDGMLNSKFDMGSIINSAELREYSEIFNSRWINFSQNNGIIPPLHFIWDAPDEKTKNELYSYGLKYVDAEHLFAQGLLPHNGNFALDTTDCQIPSTVMNKLQLLASREYYFPYIEKVWLDQNLPTFMKFFLQMRVDTSYQESNFIIKALQNKKFYCWGLITGLNSNGFLSENYRNVSFEYLNELFNEITEK